MYGQTLNEKICVYKSFHAERLDTYHFYIKEIQDRYCNFLMCVLQIIIHESLNCGQVILYSDPTLSLHLRETLNCIPDIE